MAAIFGIAVLWTSCQKEINRTPVAPTKNVSQERVSGVVQDDPIAVSKVPVIMSADYLEKIQNLSTDFSSLSARGGNLSSGGGKADKIAPVISITSPSAGATVTGTTSISVSATDNSGKVASVSLYVDNVFLNSSGTSPFTFSWTTGSNGSHTLYATAKDAAGNQGTSSSITVTVNNVATTPPTISIVSPAANSTFDFNVNVPVTVSVNNVVTKVTQWEKPTERD